VEMSLLAGNLLQLERAALRPNSASNLQDEAMPTLGATQCTGCSGNT
jgi:hypothetical protein